MQKNSSQRLTVKSFNPNNIGIANGNYFGFPFQPEESRILILPVPWDVTTSYGAGTSKGPQAILDASIQLDFFDSDVNKAWEIGHATLPVNLNTVNQNLKFRPEAESVIKHLENNLPLDENIQHRINLINKASEELNNYVYTLSRKWLAKGKLIALVGGDHSTPFGLIKALSEFHDNFAILQIDAHADLRDAYEGFEYSHASIMFNVFSKIENIRKIIQVGIRDFCEEEYLLMKQNKKIVWFTDNDISGARFEGKLWQKQCKEIIKELPDKIYLSFDIDGLSREFCPNTGTPVPGGLSFNEAIYLVKSIVEAGKKIIGFDLTEVTPGKNNEWDANVGARILYKISNLMFKSQK